MEALKILGLTLKLINRGNVNIWWVQENNVEIKVVSDYTNPHFAEHHVIAYIDDPADINGYRARIEISSGAGWSTYEEAYKEFTRKVRLLKDLCYRL